MSTWSDWYWDERFGFAFLILGWMFVALAALAAISLARRWWHARRGTPACHQCHYDLRGLTSVRAGESLTCPECGTVQMTRSTGRTRFAWRRRVIQAAVLMLAAQASWMARTACLHGPARLLPDRVLVWVLNTWPDGPEMFADECRERALKWTDGDGDPTAFLTIELRRLVPLRKQWPRGYAIELRDNYLGLFEPPWTWTQRVRPNSPGGSPIHAVGREIWRFELLKIRVLSPQLWLDDAPRDRFGRDQILVVDVENHDRVEYIASHLQSNRVFIVPLSLRSMTPCESIDEVVVPVRDPGLDQNVHRTMQPRIVENQAGQVVVDWKVPPELLREKLVASFDLSVQRDGVLIPLVSWSITESDKRVPLNPQAVYLSEEEGQRLREMKLGPEDRIVVQGSWAGALQDVKATTCWDGRVEWPAAEVVKLAPPNTEK